MTGWEGGHMAHRLVCSLGVLLALAWAGFAFAQDDEALTITGVLTAIEPAADLLVRVTADEPVVITVQAPDIDPTLAVLSPVGQVVAFNDDHADAGSAGAFDLPSPRDAGVEFVPAESGLMTVRVGSFEWAYAGPYTLTLSGLEVIERYPVSILRNANGSVIEGALAALPDRVARAAYSFPALTDWPVTLRLTSDDFDAVLAVYDFSGELLVSNDDHDSAEFTLPARTDAALQLTIPADSIYYVLVQSFDDEETGRFTLTIDGADFGRASVLSEEEPQTGVCDGVLGSVVRTSSSYGGAYEAGNLLDDSLTTGWSSQGDDEHPFLIFEVNTGATVRLDGVEIDGFSASPGFVDGSVRAFAVGVATTLDDPEAFTTVLEAEAPFANELVSYTFEPVEARYVLLRPLTNYGGTYFQATEFNACTSLTGTRSGNLSGDPPFIVNGLLQPDEPYIEYRLYVQENATLTATLTGEAFDPVLEVYNEAGWRLADNDNHGPEYELPRLQDAGLSLDFPEPGPVMVRVRSFAGGGPFVLTVTGSRIQAQPPDVPLLPACVDVSSVEAGGAVVNFSTEFAGRWEAEFINDGSAETGWASAPGRYSARSESVTLELADGPQMINSFRINPSATGGDSTVNNVSRFAVLVSATDAEPESFEEVFSTLLTERYRYTLAFDLPEPVEARYVMLETRDTFGGRWHEVAEFTVCARE
ncbi:discoidin domain-containing protein [Chloroflexota bacterium]